MNDQERQLFSEIVRERARQEVKTSPAAILGATLGLSGGLLLGGIGWMWTGDARWALAGAILVLSCMIASAGLAAYHAARRK